jgi:tRNA-dihydrouridine synthase 1
MDGEGGWRMDAVLRRYLDIIYLDILKKNPPRRQPLFDLSLQDTSTTADEETQASTSEDARELTAEPPSKKQKRNPKSKVMSPNLHAMRAHLFSLLRPLISKHTYIRDALARWPTGDMMEIEAILAMVEKVTKDALIGRAKADTSDGSQTTADRGSTAIAPIERPLFVCQSHVRPLPTEAIANGAMTLSKKTKARMGNGVIERSPKLEEPSSRSRGTIEEAGLELQHKNEAVEPADSGLVCI